MKKFLILGILCVFLCLPMKVSAALMPLDGSWIVLDEYMNNGDFFEGSSGDGFWEWDSLFSVTFDITDLFVVTDVFNVYDFGVLVFSTPDLDEYTDLGINSDDAPPFTSDPDVAWTRSQYFSQESWVFGPGAHSISIQDIQIPTGFQDGTVAFRAYASNAVPEPSTLFLFGFGLIGLAGVTRRKMKK